MPACTGWTGEDYRLWEVVAGEHLPQAVDDVLIAVKVRKGHFVIG